MNFLSNFILGLNIVSVMKHIGFILILYLAILLNSFLVLIAFQGFLGVLSIQDHDICKKR